MKEIDTFLLGHRMRELRVTTYGGRFYAAIHHETCENAMVSERRDGVREELTSNDHAVMQDALDELNEILKRHN